MAGARSTRRDRASGNVGSGESIVAEATGDSTGGNAVEAYSRRAFVRRSGGAALGVAAVWSAPTIRSTALALGAAGTPPPEQQTLSETPPAEAAAGGDPADPGDPGDRDAAAHRHEPGPVDRRGQCGHRGRRRAPRRRAGPRTDTRRTLSAHASESSNSAAARSSASRRVTSRSTSSASSEYARAIDLAMSGAV